MFWFSYSYVRLNKIDPKYVMSFLRSQVTTACFSSLNQPSFMKYQMIAPIHFYQHNTNEIFYLFLVVPQILQGPTRELEPFGLRSECYILRDKKNENGIKFYIKIINTNLSIDLLYLTPFALITSKILWRNAEQFLLTS